MVENRRLPRLLQPQPKTLLDVVVPPTSSRFPCRETDDFTLCSFLLLTCFTFIMIFSVLNLIHVLLFFNFNTVNSIVSIFSFSYLLISNRFFFNFTSSYVCLYRFLFYDLYLLFLFYFLFVFINLFAFIISDIFMFFIFLDFFGLFIDLICFDFNYHSLHTLPFPCF